MDQISMVIGIDPGLTTGMAAYHCVLGKILRVATTDFWGCIEAVKACNPETTVFIIEAPVKTAMYGTQQSIADNKSKGYGNRMMSNAASNAREAELLADGIEHLGFRVKRVRPIRRKKREDGSKGKVTAEEVKEAVGYELRTNQHVRDAIMLCLEYFK